MATKKKAQTAIQKAKLTPLKAPELTNLATTTNTTDVSFNQTGTPEETDLRNLDVTKLLVPLPFTSSHVIDGTLLSLYDDTGTFYQLSASALMPDTTTTIIFDFGKSRLLRNWIFTYSIQQTGSVSSRTDATFSVSEDGVNFYTITSETFNGVISAERFRDIIFGAVKFRFVAVQMKTWATGASSYVIKLYEMKCFI